MSKVLRIEDEGFVWHVPAESIAKNRAAYYAENDKGATYEDEFKFTMGDNYELRDWFFNNMDWEDVEKDAHLVGRPETPTKPRLNHDGLNAKVIEASP